MIGSIIGSYVGFWTNVLNISGRTKRFDFWVPTIINWILFGAISAVLYRWSHTVGYVVGIIAIVATVTLFIRRLRDAGHTPWLTLLMLTGIGTIILYILCLQRSK